MGSKGRKNCPQSFESQPDRPSNLCRLTITKFAHKARVVGNPTVAAILTALDMTAEGGRAAVLDGRHHL